VNDWIGVVRMSYLVGGAKVLLKEGLAKTIEFFRGK
jgi:hypothetical protein